MSPLSVINSIQLLNGTNASSSLSEHNGNLVGGLHGIGHPDLNSYDCESGFPGMNTARFTYDRMSNLKANTHNPNPSFNATLTGFNVSSTK